MPTEENKNNGRFAKGTSGNPAGRPPGSRNRAALLMEALLEGEAEQLCRKAVDLALKDNTRALQLCLDRLMPPPKDRVVSFDLPKLQSLDDIPQGVSSILTAISEGSISPREGETLSRILIACAEALTTADTQQRLERLEEGRLHDEQVKVVKSYE